MHQAQWLLVILKRIKLFLESLLKKKIIIMGNKDSRGKQDFGEMHLELSKQDVINNAEIEKPFYTSAIKDLIKYAVMVYSKNAKNTLESVTTVMVDYQPVVFKKNPVEVWQVRTYEKLNGVKSPIDFIMEDNPDLTRAEAEERYEQVQADLDKFADTGSLDKFMQKPKEQESE